MKLTTPAQVRNVFPSPVTIEPFLEEGAGEKGVSEMFFKIPGQDMVVSIAAPKGATLSIEVFRRKAKR